MKWGWKEWFTPEQMISGLKEKPPCQDVLFVLKQKACTCNVQGEILNEGGADNLANPAFL